MNLRDKGIFSGASKCEESTADVTMHIVKMIAVLCPSLGGWAKYKFGGSCDPRPSCNRVRYMKLLQQLTLAIRTLYFVPRMQAV